MAKFWKKRNIQGLWLWLWVFGLRSIQINIEPTKASIWSYKDLPPDLKNSKSLLSIRNYKDNCLQLTTTAWLHPAMDHATRESKCVNNLIEPRQQHEDDFAYIIRIQKLYNINIWVYTPCGEGNLELFKPVDDFDKDRKYVRILVWGNPCALIKNIENLLDRPKKRIISFFTVIDVHIGLFLKLNMTNTNLVTLSNKRLIVLRKNFVLL